MIKDFETEISGFQSESMKQRKMLYTLEKAREKFGADASDANAKFAAALEEACCHDTSFHHSCRDTQ